MNSVLFTSRSIWTMIHGIILGGGALLGLSDALFSLATIRTADAADATAQQRLPPVGRDAVLTEMRTMLGSVHAILDAATRSDTAAMRQAAAASGSAMAADPTLEKYLPKEFLKLGMSTHLQFDSLAAAVRGPAASDTAIARLSRLTGSCVSCHATCRLGVR